MNIQTLVESNFFEPGCVDNITEIAKGYGLIDLKVIAPIGFEDDDCLNILFGTDPNKQPSFSDLVHFLNDVKKKHAFNFEIKLHNIQLLQECVDVRAFNAEIIEASLAGVIPIKDLQNQTSLEEQFAAQKGIGQLLKISGGKRSSDEIDAESPAKACLVKNKRSNSDANNKQFSKSEDSDPSELLLQFLATLNERERRDKIEELGRNIEDRFGDALLPTVGKSRRIQ